MNNLSSEGPGQPPRELRGDLWSLARWSEITSVLGEPEERSERSVLLMLSRLLSTDETRRLLVLIQRAIRAARND
jgi:hypothetical protein